MFGSRKANVREEVPENICSVEKQLLYGEDIEQGKFRGNMDSGSDDKIFFPSGDGSVGFGMTDEMLSKHLLLLGGTGSGKTNVINFIIKSLQSSMTDDDVMIIFDSKGDYKKKFFDHDNPRHILIANDDSYRQISKSWNIFGELKNANGEYDETVTPMIAKEFSKQLFVGRESSQQPFFTQAAADIISKLLIHMIREAKENKQEELTTSKFVEFIRSATAVSYHNMLCKHKDFQSATTYLGIRTDASAGNKAVVSNQGLGVIAEINSMANDMFMGPFAESYENGSISMQEIVREKNKRIVFIEYDLGVGSILSPMYRILFDFALKEALGGRREKRGNTYLIIDEASVLPNLMHLQDALNFGRSLGVKVIAGLQSISQLYDAYGAERGKVIVAGFMNSFCFHTWDLESRKFISERFGANCSSLAYYHNVQADAIVFQREGHVVEDWDILNLEVGQAVVNLTMNRPVRFKYKFRKY